MTEQICDLNYNIVRGRALHEQITRGRAHHERIQRYEQIARALETRDFSHVNMPITEDIIISGRQTGRSGSMTQHTLLYALFPHQEDSINLINRANPLVSTDLISLFSTPDGTEVRIQNEDLSKDGIYQMSSYIMQYMYLYNSIKIEFSYFYILKSSRLTAHLISLHEDLMNKYKFLQERSEQSHNKQYFLKYLGYSRKIQQEVADQIITHYTTHLTGLQLTDKEITRAKRLLQDIKEIPKSFRMKDNMKSVRAMVDFYQEMCDYIIDKVLHEAYLLQLQSTERSEIQTSEFEIKIDDINMIL